MNADTNLLRCLPYSRTVKLREANEQGEHLIQGKQYDQPEKLELSPLEKERDEECQTKENSPVEIIYERRKRFHTNEIDARKRLRLREEKGGRAGKQRQLGDG